MEANLPTTITGVIVAVVILAGVVFPILSEAGGGTPDIVNDGILCSKIDAGYSATASAPTTEQYALIGETVSITRTADQLHAVGVGIDAMAEEFAISFDGTNLTVGDTIIACAWAFVPDGNGAYRYGEGGAALSIDEVYGAGSTEEIYYSIAGADAVKVGGIA